MSQAVLVDPAFKAIFLSPVGLITILSLKNILK